MIHWRKSVSTALDMDFDNSNTNFVAFCLTFWSYDVQSFFHLYSNIMKCLLTFLCRLWLPWTRGQLPKQFLILGVLTLVILMSRTHQISARIPEISVATDLKSSADQFPDKVVVLYFTAEYCMYCQALDREVLGPVLRSGDFEAISQFFRVQHDEPETKLTDFDGKKISNRDLIQRYQVDVTPTIIFLGPDGREVASSIVGFLTVDFYGAYLDQSIQDGRTHLLSKTN